MKRAFSRIVLFLTSALFCVVISGCGKSGQGKSGAGSSPEGDQTVYELKLGHQSPEAEGQHRTAVKFKDAVEAKSDGRVRITIYPMAQLGYDRDLIEGMQFGTIDLALVTSSPLANFVSGFGALDLPFIFRDWDHVEHVLRQPFIQDLYKEGEEKGLVVFELLPRGFRSVTNSKKPITQLSDFRGLKLRVIESPVFVTTFEALGATVTAMSWGEVFTALQQGAIDGQENSIEVINNERVFEVQKYVSLTQHIFAFGTFCASKASFDKLPKDIQDMIRECAVQATIDIGVESREREAEFAGMLVDKGMEFNDIDKTTLRPVVQRAYDDFIAKNGQGVAALIDNIESTK
jgi:tripartite ATP-independent transporter DctP family solute receptor